MSLRNRTVRRTRAWWMVNAREARQHAIVLAVATWLASTVITFGSSGPATLVGVRKAPDFLQFYTLGLLAREGRIREAYDWEAFHAKQVMVAPTLADSLYPPVYPPQAAVLFIPFSGLSLSAATTLWTLTTIVGYALVVWCVWSVVREQLADRVLVFAAAAGFPPFWSAVMNGQVTIVILAACVLGWLALARGRRFWAGAALGLFAIKPQFGLPFAIIVLARRDWQMMFGAIASVIVQALIVWWVLGFEAFAGYAAMLPTIAAHADELEAKPFQSHSIRALTRLLPDYLGVPLWAGLVGVVLWKTARVWMTEVPLTVRYGLVVLAAVLVNPHLIVYDAAILVMPLIWFGAWVIDEGNSITDVRNSALSVQTYGVTVYALILTLVAPSAALIRFQLSVLVMLWLFWRVERMALTTATTQ